jgi:hypothetical protein
MKFAIALVLGVTAGAQQLGVYLGWVGTYPGNRLEAGARLAKSSGFQVIRLPLVASVDADFGIGTACDRRLTLAQVAALPEYASVLGDPAFRTIFLTTWGDSHSYDPCRPRDPRSDQHPAKLYLQAAYYSAENRDRMRAEYADLTYQLYKTYRGSEKMFAISNWEGDNELYCDAAAYFVTKPAFRSDCEARRKTGDVVQAYREYLTLRHEGIEDGRKRAEHDGFRGVSVTDVVEFSSFHLLAANRLADMLEDVIPSVPASAFVSYSAWESLGDRLYGDLEALKKRFGERLIAGEFGFDRGLDSSAPAHAVDAVGDMGKAGIRYAVFWQIFDQPPLEGLGDKGLYGMYDRDGQITAAGAKLREMNRK